MAAKKQKPRKNFSSYYFFLKMSNGTEKEFIEKEYHLSGIGGGFSVQFASSYVYDAAPGGARDACKRAAEKMKATLPRVASARLYQAVLDAVRDRVGDAICIPHLPIDFRHTLTPSDRARTIRQKWKFSLQDALAHVLDVCSAEYDGALLAFSVRSGGAAQPDHMNMIYVAFGGEGDEGGKGDEGATCHLFEPNGEQYARSTDGMQRLERAWAAALQRQGAAHDPQVRLCGGTGVQTALGTRSVAQVGSTRVTTRRGYAVCGAVTWWMFVEWLCSDSRAEPYVDFEAARVDELEGSGDARATHAASLRAFITSMRADVEAKFRAVDHKSFLERDMREAAEAVRASSATRRRRSSRATATKLRRGSHSCMIDVDMDLCLQADNPALCKEVQLRYTV
jgi:hypothetical protein